MHVPLDRHLSGAVFGVVSTCNRVEVYADAEKFDGGFSAISELLARHPGIDLAQLTRHRYVYYEQRAVHHLFAVTCGLDSVAGGLVRSRSARSGGAAGSAARVTTRPPARRGAARRAAGWSG